jgi:xanthine dehydrogenase FAD-binding subunit
VPEVRGVTEVVSPADRDELVAALSRATPRTCLLAGGTDLVRAMRSSGGEPDLLIDLSSLSDLAYVRLEDATVRVGATTTFAELQRDSRLHEHGLCLAQAAGHVGSVQIRNVATLGGNVANASPCADGVTALLALDAEVTTIDGAGHVAPRRVADLLLGPNQTGLGRDEAIIEFSFAALGAEHRSSFVKIGSRTTVSVARLSCALVAGLDVVSGTLTGVRVALGAVGATAFRLQALETLLQGRPADERTARLLADGVAEGIGSSIPERPSLAYKEAAAVGLAYDAWNALALSPPCEPPWPS